MSNKSNHTLSSKNISQHTIPVRIDFIKGLLKDKDLQPMVNFDNTDTDNFIQAGDGDDFEDSHGSNGSKRDTRIRLHKKDFNFNNIINQIGGRLEYIKSGTTGHTFKGISFNDAEEINYAVKVVAYPKKEKYGDIYNISRPENAELLMIRLLSYFVVKKRTPHIVLPIHTFYTSIKHFINLIDENVADAKDENGKDSKYAEFVAKYQAGEFHNEVSILISEWANRGDFLDFMRKNYKRFELKHWKAFFFQIISALAVIQTRFPSFRHNDLKANNVLIHKVNTLSNNKNAQEEGRLKYTIAGKVYNVPDIGYQLKLWDFDFACIPDIVDNSKVSLEWTKTINVTPHQNRYYDLHYFFNTLISKAFLPQIMTDPNVHKDVKDFINRIVPDKYRQGKYTHKRGRILVNDEYTTPGIVLATDQFFSDYRKDAPVPVGNSVVPKQNVRPTNQTGGAARIPKMNINIPANKQRRSRRDIDNIKLGDLLND